MSYEPYDEQVQPRTGDANLAIWLVLVAALLAFALVFAMWGPNDRVQSPQQNPQIEGGTGGSTKQPSNQNPLPAPK